MLDQLLSVLFISNMILFWMWIMVNGALIVVRGIAGYLVVKNIPKDLIQEKNLIVYGRYNYKAILEFIDTHSPNDSEKNKINFLKKMNGLLLTNKYSIYLFILGNIGVIGWWLSLYWIRKGL